MMLSIDSIPQTWKVNKLGKIASFLDGKRKPIKESDREAIQGKYPYYGASCIIDYVNDFIFDDELILLGEDGANILTRTYPLAFKVTGKVWVNNHAHVIKPRENINIDYLTYYLESLSYEKYNSGTAQPKLNLETCKKINVLLPPLQEQNVIGGILLLWDEAIEKLEKLIAAKRKIKKALMQQLLTGKKRFKKFVTSTEMSKYHFYELPKDWEDVRVADIAKEITKRHDGSEVIVLSCSKYDGLVNSLDYFGKKVYSDDTSNYKIVKCGQFAYPSNHVEEGSIGLLRHIETGIVSPIYTVFQTNEKVEPEFMYALFKTELYRHIFNANTNASINRRGSLRWREFANIYVPLPSLPEQQKIASVLNAADREIELLCDKLEMLKNQKKGLMQKLLTGKIRVKV